MKKYILSAVASLFFLVCNGQNIVINEYSASNLQEFQDDYNRTEDWIELYNTTSSAIDISGWHLSDKEDKPMKYEIPGGSVIEANGYMLFWCSGRDVSSEFGRHTNFKLAQSSGKDIVLLSDDTGTILEMYDMELTLVETSRARDIDGAAGFRVCTDPTPGESNDAATKYAGYTATPTMDQSAGFYQDMVEVALTNNEPNSVLRYTLDGRNVTESSPEYLLPIMITETTVVKARAFSNDADLLPGKMDFRTFFINEDDFTVTVFSVAANQVKQLANGQGEIIPIGSIEYFGTNGEREATSFGSLNRHGQDSWVLDHRSLDWISRDEMGYSKAVNAPLFSYSDRDEYQKFMFRNSGDDNYPAIDDFDHQGSTHVRDEYVQTLSLEGGMELDTRAVERVVLFLNGEYWGLYGMRERPVDHDYTDEYYDQGKYDIQYLSTWGDSEAEYGGIDAFVDWETIRNFVLENDMSDEANYERVDDEINLLSLIDYLIVNLNVVASDWMNYNTGWWRGLDPEGGHKKWGYILWDLDATFDYYINYSGVPNISPDADPCDIEDISDFMDSFFGDLSDISGGVIDTTDYSNCASILDGTCPYPPTDETLITLFGLNNQFINGSMCCENWTGNCQFAYDFIVDNGGIGFGDQGNVGAHEKVFLKLLDESETFKQLYYGRYADLMNTVYSCENMVETLDRMIGVIDPEMDRQIDRWGGTRMEWEQNVNDLRAFIEARCELLDDGLVECYEVTGPYELTLITQPDLVGEIDINTLDIREFPWTGDYFGGMNNTIKARVFDDYLGTHTFSHWESVNGNVIFPTDTDIRANITLTQSDTLIAVFDEISDVDDLLEQIDLKVFPNPANTYATVKYDLPNSANVHFELHNIVGQKIRDYQSIGGAKSQGAHQEIVDLTEVLDGMYLLNIYIDNQKFAKKITVVHRE